MSLDVYLTGETTTEPCRCSQCGNEHTHQVTETFFNANITHNLNVMAEAAGIYKACWRPEEIGVTKARQLIPLLREGIAKMKANRAHFETFNASNGWGLYEHFVPWLEKYLIACEDHPAADVSVSR